jgi:general secretion pathway protein D
MKMSNTLHRLTIMTLVLLLSACAGKTRDNDALLREQASSLEKERQQIRTTADRIEHYQKRDRIHQHLLADGYRYLLQKDYPKAESSFRTALTIFPDHPEARKGLGQIISFKESDRLVEQARSIEESSADNALSLAERALYLNPANEEAKRIRINLHSRKAAASQGQTKLSDALLKPVSLQLKDVSVVNALELLSQSSGINFILDKDLRADLKTTIFVRETAIKDILTLIFKTSQLQGKPLNQSTYLISPQAADKVKQYEDLIIKSYFLDGQNGKKVQEVIQALVNPKFTYLDEASSYITIRDTQDVLNVVDRIVEVADIVKPEVVLDVEILEVSTDKIKNLGIQFPTTITGSLSPIAQTANGFTGYAIDDLKNLSSDSWRIGLPDPAIVANLKYQDGDSDILANPKIRIQNLEKANILLGDKVPVITTTINQTSSAVTESISYLDVGLKLEATPTVHPNGEVTISIDLEVSNIVKEVRSTSGLLTYQIGNRSTHTSLRSRSGETQMLAGLIKNEERASATRFPILGQLPLLGKLFSNESDTRNKTEIVLLITPHIVRSVSSPAAHNAQFISGSLDRASTSPFMLGESGSIQMGERPLELLPAAQPAANDAPKLIDLDSATPTLSLIAPDRIGQDQDFLVTLASSGSLPPASKLRLDYDQNDFDFSGLVPIELAGKSTVANAAGVLTINLEDGFNGQGPVSILSFKTRRAAKGKSLLTLNAASSASKPAQLHVIIE